MYIYRYSKLICIISEKIFLLVNVYLDIYMYVDIYVYLQISTIFNGECISRYLYVCRYLCVFIDIYYIQKGQIPRSLQKKDFCFSSFLKTRCSQCTAPVLDICLIQHHCRVREYLQTFRSHLSHAFRQNLIRFRKFGNKQLHVSQPCLRSANMATDRQV